MPLIEIFVIPDSYTLIVNVFTFTPVILYISVITSPSLTKFNCMLASNLTRTLPDGTLFNVTEVVFQVVQLPVLLKSSVEILFPFNDNTPALLIDEPLAYLQRNL